MESSGFFLPFSFLSVPGGDLQLHDMKRMSRNITPPFALDADEVLFLCCAVERKQFFSFVINVWYVGIQHRRRQCKDSHPFIHSLSDLPHVLIRLYPGPSGCQLQSLLTGYLNLCQKVLRFHTQTAQAFHWKMVSLWRIFMAGPGFMRNMRKASSHSLNNLYVTLSGEFNGKIQSVTSNVTLIHSQQFGTWNQADTIVNSEAMSNICQNSLKCLYMIQKVFQCHVSIFDYQAKIFIFHMDETLCMTTHSHG